MSQVSGPARPSAVRTGWNLDSGTARTLGDDMSQRHLVLDFPIDSPADAKGASREAFLL